MDGLPFPAPLRKHQAKVLSYQSRRVRGARLWNLCYISKTDNEEFWHEMDLKRRLERVHWMCVAEGLGWVDVSTCVPYLGTLVLGSCPLLPYIRRLIGQYFYPFVKREWLNWFMLLCLVQAPVPAHVRELLVQAFRR